MLFIFSMSVLIRHLWQLKTVVFQHRCLIHAVILAKFVIKTIDGIPNMKMPAILALGDISQNGTNLFVLCQQRKPRQFGVDDVTL